MFSESGCNSELLRHLIGILRMFHDANRTSDLAHSEFAKVSGTLIVFKMISAEHASNNGKKKFTKKTSWHGNILNAIKKNLSSLKLSSSPRERKLNFKLSIFQLKQTFCVS